MHGTDFVGKKEALVVKLFLGKDGFMVADFGMGEAAEVIVGKMGGCSVGRFFVDLVAALVILGFDRCFVGKFLECDVTKNVGAGDRFFLFFVDLDDLATTFGIAIFFRGVYFCAVGKGDGGEGDFGKTGEAVIFVVCVVALGIFGGYFSATGIVGVFGGESAIAVDFLFRNEPAEEVIFILCVKILAGAALFYNVASFVIAAGLLTTSRVFFIFYAIVVVVAKDGFALKRVVSIVELLFSDKALFIEDVDGFGEEDFFFVVEVVLFDDFGLAKVGHLFSRGDVGDVAMGDIGEVMLFFFSEPSSTMCFFTRPSPS